MVLLGVQLSFAVLLTVAAGRLLRFSGVFTVLGGWLAFAGAIVRLPGAGTGTGATETVPFAEISLPFVTVPLLFAAVSLLFATLLTHSLPGGCLLLLPPWAAFLTLSCRAQGARAAFAVFLPTVLLSLCGAALSFAGKARTARELAKTRQAAERDPLTGLLNRRALEARFPAVAEWGNFALAVADLDHFKAVNDRAGHSAGDAVLVDFCRFTERFFGERGFSFVFSRFGGDEFVLLFPEVTAKEELKRATDDYCRALHLREPGAPVSCTCSVGLVFSAEPATELRPVFDAADRELYRAKRQAAGRETTR